MDDLDDLVPLLINAGAQMVLDGVELIQRRPDAHKTYLFLVSQGEMLKQLGEWVFAQQIAGVFDYQDIVRMVGVHADVAKTYLAERESVPA